MGLLRRPMAECAPTDTRPSHLADAHTHDAQLLADLRRGERHAVASFYRQYQPLLTRQARRLGLAPAECEIAALEVLADVALALMGTDAAVPRRLAAYVTVALRHWIEMRHRAESSYRRWCTAAAGITVADAATGDGMASTGSTMTTATAHRASGARHASPDVGSVVESLISESARRASAGLDWSPAPAHAALVALAARLDEILREDDRLLLVWTSQGVPLRTAAEWLGVSYAVAAKRASRLRARLRVMAITFADSLPPEDRRYLHRFLARASTEHRTVAVVAEATHDQATHDQATHHQETAR